MRRTLATLCLLAGWFCANGIVWNMVQVVGWVKMYHQYSQVMPARQALRVTFDGSRACDLCHLSQGARENEQRELPRDTLGAGTDKILLIADVVPDTLVPGPDRTWPGLADETGRCRTDHVPVPPPRV